MVPKELWTKVHNIVQEAWPKPSQRKSNGRRQSNCLRKLYRQLRKKKEKAKEKWERYTHLNAEFQRRARRNKKAFLSEWCKKIKENKRIGKTRGLFKKAGDTKGKFHAKMVTIKNRNGKEAEEIKKRWKEYTGGLYKGVNDLDNHEVVVTHLEPDILECEVKWALESITRNKASGGGRIPAELFQSLKDDAVKMLSSVFQQIWKTKQWP